MIGVQFRQSFLEGFVTFHRTTFLPLYIKYIFKSYIRLSRNFFRAVILMISISPKLKEVVWTKTNLGQTFSGNTGRSCVELWFLLKHPFDQCIAILEFHLIFCSHTFSADRNSMSGGSGAKILSFGSRAFQECLTAFWLQLSGKNKADFLVKFFKWQIAYLVSLYRLAPAQAEFAVRTSLLTSPLWSLRVIDDYVFFLLNFTCCLLPSFVFPP